MRNLLKSVVAGCLVLVTSGVAAGGTYSTISPVGATGETDERNVARILNDLLGHNPGWVPLKLIGLPSENVNLGAGDRVFDEAGPGEVSDKIWADGIVNVTFTAMWWGGKNQQHYPNTVFGYNLNGGAVIPVFQTHPGAPGYPELDWGESVTTAYVNPGDIRWYCRRLQPVPPNGFPSPDLYSDPAFTGNWGNRNDVMVAFDVSNMSLKKYAGGSSSNPGIVDFLGNTGPEAYLLFFATIDPTTTGNLLSYNDLVVLVQHVHPIPEPLTVVGVLAGLGSCWSYLRKRRTGG